jgi:hypothetical protein
MTPLAHHITRLLAEPIKKRPHNFQQQAHVIRELMNDVHFFEITEIQEVIFELQATLGKVGTDLADEAIGARAFLPAPRTWIEWKAHGERQAVLCIENGDRAFCWSFHELPEGDVALNWYGYMSLHSGDIVCGRDGMKPGEQMTFRFPESAIQLINDRLNGSGTQYVLACLAFAQMAIVIINSPRFVGRKIHPPHKGLVKLLRNSWGGGKFPLHGWTELKLHVNKPIELDDGQPHEATLTGRRALHFVRKFMRVRLGKIEYVVSHWRGDASIGIKQTRYTVEP